MKKHWRSTGFTLVELMMVIAIIAILALVLIPQAGFMKQYAKDAGVETNIRVVEATAIRLLVKFPASQDGLADFNLAMAWMLDDNVRNPFTQNQQCLPLAAALPTVCTAGVQGVGSGTDGFDQTTTLFPGTSAVAPGNRGAVFFSAFLDASEGLVCHVWGYDGDGRIVVGSLLSGVGSSGLVGFFNFNGSPINDMAALLAQGFAPGWLGSWTITENGLSSTGTGQQLLYKPLASGTSAYKINATAALNAGPGYGILFDSTVGSSNRDSGYSLQYEKYGGGRIIVRSRTNGNEASTPLYTYTLSSSQQASLASSNAMTLDVRDDPSTPGGRIMTPTLNGVALPDFTYVGTSGTHTGFRTWDYHGLGTEVVITDFNVE